jgi:hypothetical protein
LGKSTEVELEADRVVVTKAESGRVGRKGRRRSESKGQMEGITEQVTVNNILCSSKSLEHPFKLSPCILSR